MSAMRDHLKELHTRQAEHHLEKAKHHTAMHKHHSALADNFDGMDGQEQAADCHREISECHKSMSAEHAGMGEFHVECCKTLDSMKKATGMFRDDELMPDFVSSIAPEAPHLRAVPRYGSPEIEVTKIAPGLEEMLKIE